MDDDLCADCLESMGPDGVSCDCYCRDCGEWNPDCACDEE